MGAIFDGYPVFWNINCRFKVEGGEWRRSICTVSLVMLKPSDLNVWKTTMAVLMI